MLHAQLCHLDAESHHHPSVLPIPSPVCPSHPITCVSFPSHYLSVLLIPSPVCPSYPSSFWYGILCTEALPFFSAPWKTFFVVAVVSRCGLQVYTTIPGLCSTGSWAQGLVHAWQALYHLSYTPSFKVFFRSPHAITHSEASSGDRFHRLNPNLEFEGVLSPVNGQYLN